jgi:integrase
VEKRIGYTQVRGLRAGETLWDPKLAGFGIRRQKGIAVTYVLKYRTAEGRQRWLSIGRHGSPWTPEDARTQATKLLGQVAEGEDPAAAKQSKRAAETVAELCDLYLADAESGKLLLGKKRKPKKFSTLVSDRSRIERHIKPLLGNSKVATVTSDDVERFMHDVAEGKMAGKTKTAKRRGLSNVRGGKGAATRTVGLLGGIFTYAVRKGMRTNNPVVGVTRYADGVRERRLSGAEYESLGRALQRATKNNAWPYAIAMVKFLALTGWRVGDAQSLCWCDVDVRKRKAVLLNTKSEKSERPLSGAACDVLRKLAGERDDALVFQATRGKGAMTGFRKMWNQMMQGMLPNDVTPNVLRHSFASLSAIRGVPDSLCSL